LAIAAALWILVVKLGEDETLAGPGLAVMPADLGGPFLLTDHEGERVTEAAFEGRPTLVYFGYSFCPDICPTTLQTMAEAMASTIARTNGVRGAFITVDPARDTVETLADYVPLFHDDLRGLTGSPAEIDRVARSFRVFHQLRKEVDPEAYPVDHSSYIYFMTADWRLAAVFRHDATAADIEAALNALL
jgi:protein SCO1/2